MAIHGKGRARFAAEGDKLLVELANHPRSADLPHALFGTAYAHSFDVPARSAEAIARLQEIARRLVNCSHLSQRIRQLGRIRKDWIKQMKEFLKRADGSISKQFVAASLGNAQAAIELFSDPGYKEIPDEMRKENSGRRRSICTVGQ